MDVHSRLSDRFKIRWPRRSVISVKGPRNRIARLIRDLIDEAKLIALFGPVDSKRSLASWHRHTSGINYEADAVF
jgi:hypothetical protein